MTIRRTAFRELATSAESERQVEAGVPPGQFRVPTMEERALIFLRATEGKEDFTNDGYMGARGKILDAMAAHIAARSEPEQTGESETTPPPTLPEDLVETGLRSALQNREEANARMPMHFEEPEGVFAVNLERGVSAKEVGASMARPMSSVGVGHQTYNLDEDARDRLLAHGRQDAAHAVLNTSLLNDVLLLKSRVRRLTIMGILALLLLTLVLLVVSFRR
jgi:hypothetical protein